MILRSILVVTAFQLHKHVGRYFNFDMHHRSMAVGRLPFHEENCSIVNFQDLDKANVGTEVVLRDNIYKMN